MSENNIARVRKMIEAFNRDDVAAVLGTFDEACQLHEPPEMPDTPADGFRGHDGIRQWMANLRETGAVEFEPTSFTARDDLVFCEIRSRGRGQSSGAPFGWTTYAVARVERDRIVRLWAFLSRDAALQAAGLTPPVSGHTDW